MNRGVGDGIQGNMEHRVAQRVVQESVGYRPLDFQTLLSGCMSSDEAG